MFENESKRMIISEVLRIYSMILKDQKENIICTIDEYDHFRGFQNIFHDLKGPKGKYNLHYRWVRGDFLRPHNIQLHW